MSGLPSVVLPRIIAAMIDAAARSATGAFAELGVYQGGTAWWLAELARKQGRALWLFDTFAGIPFADPVDLHQVGDFADTSLEAVRAAIPDAIIVPGVFPASIGEHALPPFAFVHVDADQYRSVAAACEVFGASMAPGGVIWFDDYGHPNTPGATQAVDEAYGERVERMEHAGGRALVRFQ